jgi:DNA gyrase subunit A
VYNQNEKVEPVNVAEEMSKSFLDYSMSVIISRALPDARDGLKPSQRRILYAMNELGCRTDSQASECAKIVGETMGNYHRTAIRRSTRRSCTWRSSGRCAKCYRGQGNFGSVEGDPPASMRYTEARLRHLGARADDGHGQGHGGLSSRTMTNTRGADSLSRGIPEPARQWRHWHRRRYGD